MNEHQGQPSPGSSGDRCGRSGDQSPRLGLPFQDLTTNNHLGQWAQRAYTGTCNAAAADAGAPPGACVIDSNCATGTCCVNRICGACPDSGSPPPDSGGAPDTGGSSGGGCNTCLNCNGQACIAGACGSCTNSSQCCAPFECNNMGQCVEVAF